MKILSTQFSLFIDAYLYRTLVLVSVAFFFLREWSCTNTIPWFVTVEHYIRNEMAMIELGKKKIEAEGKKRDTLKDFGNTFLHSWCNACDGNYWFEQDCLPFSEIDRFYLLLF